MREYPYGSAGAACREMAQASGKLPMSRRARNGDLSGMSDTKHLLPAVCGEVLLALGIIPFTSLIWLIVFRWGDPFWFLSRGLLDLRPLHWFGAASLVLGAVLLWFGWRGVRRADRRARRDRGAPSAPQDRS